MPLPPVTRKRHLDKRHCLMLICAFLFFPILSCAMDLHVAGNDEPVSLQELEILCRLPAPCGAQLTCPGRTVSLWGYVDPASIFSKQRFPNLPYEKFKLVDHQNHSIEVWAQAKDNQPIFDKLARRPSDRIVIAGELVAFDMPITGRCMQGLKVLIHDDSQIAFK